MIYWVECVKSEEKSQSFEKVSTHVRFFLLKKYPKKTLRFRYYFGVYKKIFMFYLPTKMVNNYNNTGTKLL